MDLRVETMVTDPNNIRTVGAKTRVELKRKKAKVTAAKLKKGELKRIY